jgi:hypothetical protein
MTAGAGKARVYYKAGKAGTQENDVVHIYVPGLYTGTKLAKPMDVTIGESISPDPANEGIFVTGIQVVKENPGALKGMVRSRGLGRVVVTVNREAAHTTEDVIEGIQSHVFPKIQIGDVKYVTSDSQLPGGSTGPGPADQGSGGTTGSTSGKPAATPGKLKGLAHPSQQREKRKK